MKIQGMTLIEILVAMLLSSLMAAALVHYYLYSKINYRDDEQQVNRVIDSLWTATLLRQDLQKAGFTPCQSLQTLHSLDRRKIDTQALKAITVIQSPLPQLQIQYMDAHYATLLTRISGQQFVVETDSRWQNGDGLLIADCDHAEVHTLKSIHYYGQQARIGLLNAPLTAFKPPIYVGQWIEKRWSIRPLKNGQMALFHGSAAREEEISNEIDRLQVTWLQSHPEPLLEIILGKGNKELQHFSVWLRNL